MTGSILALARKGFTVQQMSVGQVFRHVGKNEIETLPHTMPTVNSRRIKYLNMKKKF